MSNRSNRYSEWAAKLQALNAPTAKWYCPSCGEEIIDIKPAEDSDDIWDNVKICPFCEAQSFVEISADGVQRITALEEALS